MKKGKTKTNDQMCAYLDKFRTRGLIAIEALFKIMNNNCLKSKKIAREALKKIEEIKL